MIVVIVGWVYLFFGKYSDQMVESMIVKVVGDVIKDVGIVVEDVDEILFGYFNVGFLVQDFIVFLVLQVDLVLCFILVICVENVCVMGFVVVY